MPNINNRKIILKPAESAEKPTLDVGESSIFSRKIDLNLWENAEAIIKKKKPKEKGLQQQIFILEQETKKFEQLLAKPKGKNIDFNC